MARLYCASASPTEAASSKSSLASGGKPGRKCGDPAGFFDGEKPLGKLPDLTNKTGKKTYGKTGELGHFYGSMFPDMVFYVVVQCFFPTFDVLCVVCSGDFWSLTFLGLSMFG